MLKVVYNTKSILLPGDIQGRSLANLVTTYPTEFPKFEISDSDNSLMIKFSNKKFGGQKFKKEELKSYIDTFYMLMSEYIHTHHAHMDIDVFKVAYAGDKLTEDGMMARIDSFPDYVGNAHVNELLNYLSLRADALRLPHHGSCDGIECQITRGFIKAVQPSILFSSSGLQSVYGHPRCEIAIPPIDDVTMRDAVSPICYTCYGKSNIEGARRHPLYVFKEERAILSTVTCDTGNPNCEIIDKDQVHQETFIIKFTINPEDKIDAELNLYVEHSNAASDKQCRNLQW